MSPVEAPVGRQNSYIRQVSVYENYSRKRTTPLTDTFSDSQGCLLTGESTVFKFGLNHVKILKY